MARRLLERRGSQGSGNEYKFPAQQVAGQLSPPGLDPELVPRLNLSAAPGRLLMTLNRDAIELAHPDLKAALKAARAYRTVRLAELANAHGHVSAGVAAMLTTASIQMAHSRYMYEAFARAEADTTTAVLAILAKATSLANDARNNELAAWELCAREAQAHKASAQNGLAPWERKVGRPPTAPVEVLAPGTEDAQVDSHE